MATTSGLPATHQGSQGMPETSPAPFRYRIDPASYQTQGRSLTLLLQERMCEESRARLGEPVEKRVPVEDTKTRRVKFEKRTTLSGADPIAEIAECCSKTPAYRDSQLPLKEVLYRLLLAGDNKPKSTQELYEEVVEWVGYGDGRVINPGVLQRLLEHDDYYGFAAVPGES